jgi:predicted nucleotidyltransferase component of viral defense system
MGAKNHHQMNNVITDFPKILELAKGYGLSLGKKRAILREYLQVKILDLIYQEKISSHLYFVGGTSLRLLYGLDRFSEDLDFDIAKIPQGKIDSLVNKIFNILQKENIELQLYRNITSRRIYYEFRFIKLLYQLRLSSHRDEKLMIKFDFERFWQGENREVILLNRYGFLSNVVTINFDQILTQKLTAYLKRGETQPRDIYDIVWLASQGAKIDRRFLIKNNIPKDLLTKAKEKFMIEKNKLRGFKLRLRPFLINESSVNKLDLFPQIITKFFSDLVK